MTENENNNPLPGPEGVLVTPESLYLTLSDEAVADMVASHQEWIATGRGSREDSTGKQADFKGVNLSGFRFEEGTDLSGADFRGSLCRRTVFSKINLTGSLFQGADAAESEFSDAQCGFTDFKWSKLEKVKFYQTTMDGADIRAAILTDADMALAKVGDIIFDNETKLHGVNMDRIRGASAEFIAAVAAQNPAPAAPASSPISPKNVRKGGTDKGTSRA